MGGVISNPGQPVGEGQGRGRTDVLPQEQAGATPLKLEDESAQIEGRVELNATSHDLQPEPPKETSEDELATLRTLTPEQAKANAEAEAHICEVAARMAQTPVADRAPTMSSAGNVEWEIFDGAIIEAATSHTPLVDLEYLVELGRRGGVMPAGLQRVPPSALITVNNLWRLKQWGKASHKFALGVLVLSYPWLDWYHPDRHGAQLRRLLPVLEAMLFEAKRDSPYCTIGVMIDFVCLPQKPFARDEDKARFKRSLTNINVWYFHRATYVLLVTTPPPEGFTYGNTRLHSLRGWCVFERAASMVCKKRHCLLDFAAYHGATRFCGQSTTRGNRACDPVVGTCLGEMMVGRAPPVSPETFGEDMRARVVSGELKFTASADEEFVISQYTAGFLAQIQHIANQQETKFRELSFQRLAWGETQAAQLIEALSYAGLHCSFPHGHIHIFIGIGNTIDLRQFASAIEKRGLKGKFEVRMDG